MTVVQQYKGKTVYDILITRTSVVIVFTDNTRLEIETSKP